MSESTGSSTFRMMLNTPIKNPLGPISRGVPKLSLTIPRPSKSHRSSPSLSASHSFKSESSSSPLLSYVPSSLTVPQVSDSLLSGHQTSNLYPSSEIKQKDHTPDPRPLSASIVAHILLSRHNANRSPRGSPWGALGATCRRKRYIGSRLKPKI